jgi:hypothetical protein
MNNNTTYPNPVAPVMNPAEAVPPPPPAEQLPPVALDSPPVFPRQPGETPRAFGAFLAFFQLGHGRSLPAVAEALGENHDTVKQWSSKYHWSDRILAFDSGVLQAQAQTAADLHCRQTADWTRRALEFRDQEWIAGQKLLAAVLCFLENFGDREVQGMTLGQVSRALQISSLISRQALRGSHVPDETARSPLQTELAAALKKAYGPPARPSDEAGIKPEGNGRVPVDPKPVPPSPQPSAFN